MSDPAKELFDEDGPITVAASSGNVFADLGINHPEEWIAKVGLARRICEIIEARSLSPARAAELLGIGGPELSALMKGRFGGISTEKMFQYLNALGSDVEIIVRDAAPGERANTRVVSA